MRTIACGLTCIAIFVLAAPAADSAPTAGSDQSLEDLGDGLLSGGALEELLQTKPAAGDAANPKPGEPRLLPEIDELRRMLDPNQQFKPPAAGEDLGQPQQSPLVGISDRMAQAGALIESQATTGDTRVVQDEIISELDKLIAKLNEQCKKCSGSQCNKPSQQQTQSSTPKPGQGKPTASQGAQSQPAQSQVSNGGGGEAQPSTQADGDVVKELWGQLPERLRQQLMQSTADEFLPKYREDLEAYFRELAKEQSPGQRGER